MAPPYAKLQRLSPQQIRDLSVPSAEFQEWLDQNSPGKRFSIGNVEDIERFRMASEDAVLNHLQKLGPVEDTLEEINLQIPVRDGWLSHAFVVRPSPTARKDVGPLIVLYHGGGFMSGKPEGLVTIARGLARLFGAVVVSPSYRLAPEHKFPVGPNDAWDALRWIAENATILGADPTNGFIVGGVSAGGNFSPVLARRAVEEGLSPPLTGHWVAVPVSMHQDTVPERYKDIWTSWEQNKNAPLIGAIEAEKLLAHYHPNFGSPLYNPIVPGSDVGKLPPVFVMVAGMDLLRDDGIIYSYVLDDAGVPVRLKAYPGVPHTFWAFWTTLTQSKTAIIDIAKGFAWLLGTEVSEVMAEQAMLRGY